MVLTPRPRRRASVPLPVLSLEQAREAAAAYARGSRSPATWRAYQADWRDFEGWCRKMELSALPATPETVGL